MCIRDRLYIVPQVVVLVAPMNGFLLGGGKFFFQAAVLYVHHIAVVSLFFQFGKFFFGQRVVAEEGALADIIQITDVYKRQPLWSVTTQEDSGQTAVDKTEEGGDDVKSSCPL